VIAIINYGSGNIQAIANIYKRLGVEFTVVSKPDDLETADRIVLPGVGAFDQAMGELNQSGLRQALDRNVVEHRKPLLGICVGMQLLASRSQEGTLDGLGWIGGAVTKFAPPPDGDLRLPHMGWNDVRPVRENPLFEGVDLSGGYYFLHSYYFDCDREESVLATTTYGSGFASAVNIENIYGVQFHPEKSHGAGIQLLKNFASL
jgi:glutamine amidotransferase